MSAPEERREYSLGELAERFGGEVVGDRSVRIAQVATLDAAGPGQLSFLTNIRYQRQLNTTRASAVILGEDMRDATALPHIVSRNPYAYFARVSSLLNPPRARVPGIAAGAHIDSGASVSAGAYVAPGAVVEAGAVVGEGAQIGAGAEALARFRRHAARPEPGHGLGGVATIERNVVENFDQAEGWLDESLDAAEAREIEQWQLRFLADNVGLIQRRLEQGRVCEGHGDLRLEHLYFLADRPARQGLRIVDCVEFNRRFRVADVCADIAFLAMDLTWNGAPLLAERFLSSYAMESNDYDLYALVDFYESYRAFVRGKIAALVAHDAQAPEAVRERSARDARRYFRLAVASERRRLEAPIVVAVGGLIASGKSTVARRLAEHLGGAVVCADRTRKHLAGVAARDSLADAPFSGAYSEEHTRRTYDELIRRGRAALRAGRPGGRDASVRRAGGRRGARELAQSEGVPFRLVLCEAPRETLLQRLAARADRATVSDAGEELLDDFVSSWQPPEELPGEEVLRVDTTGPIGEVERRLAEQLALVPRAVGTE